MNSLYGSPLRVYICLGLLAVFGIISGLQLPISMFPNSSKPVVMVQVPYASLTPEEFSKVYGLTIENRLHSLADNEIKIYSIETNYTSNQAQFKVTFDWGVQQKRALKEVETSIYGLSAQFPKEMRDRLQVNSWSENSGFLAISVYSDKRSLDELFDLIEPPLAPRLAQVQGAEEAVLWNPSQKEIQIELSPSVMAALQVLPKDVASAVATATNSQNGGSLVVNTNNIKIQMPRPALTLEDLKHMPILSRSGRAVHLGDIAQIDYRVSAQNARSFKTSGRPSLIVFATPAPGGNIKKMAEDILRIVDQVKKTWPEDVHAKVLVDPSEFIRDSINNVFREVVIAAMLAVVILFLFIGSLRNVATAAIEIPLSIVLAFILMRLTGININLISLGGLALSAGMNVDASVVVMENIFRHFDMHKGPLTRTKRLEIIGQAVQEVRLPVIASTIASVVVFLPLAFTSDLSYAILGDLAKTVVFSHSFSAVVALILVPTIRMQLMSGEKDAHSVSPIEPAIRWVESKYSELLTKFLRDQRLQWGTYAALFATLALLITFVLPRLPREIIGMPDTDWIVIALNTQGNSMTRQMEEQTAEVEARMLKQFGKDVSYTFTQIQGANRASILARLKDKGQMQEAWKQMQDHFHNTPFMQFFVIPWNPSELPIPDPPHFRISVLGGSARERLETAHELDEMLQGKKLFSRVWQKPAYDKAEQLMIQPHLEQWSGLVSAQSSLAPEDLADISRIATQGRLIGQWVLGNRISDIVLYYPQSLVQTPEDLAAFPLGVKNKIIPLKAVADVNLMPGEAPRFRNNQQDTVWLMGKQDKRDESKADSAARSSTELVREWEKQNKERLGTVSLQVDDPQWELNEALHQLGWAVGLSVLLIFVTMVIQLGDVVSSLLVLVAIPLGFIGVIISLYLAGSTLSLNSVLGVILLNGIAVANSIILVDFFNKLVQSGCPVVDAAIEAAGARLRPILMTSLTTAIGMLPIALGLGEGGRVLQPLGIAVSGGLAISVAFTLFLVPSLQVQYLSWRKSRLKEMPPVMSEHLSELSH